MDIVFLWNWILILCNFLFIHRLDNKKIRIKRLIIYSLLDALILSIIYIITLKQVFIIYLLIYTSIFILILWIYFDMPNAKDLFKACIYCLICDFCIYGISAVLRDYTFKNYILSAFLCLIIIYFYVRIKIKNKLYENMTLETANHKFINCIGFRDSGNFLCDLSGKPVIVVDYKFASKLLDFNIEKELSIFNQTGFFDYEKLNQKSNIYFNPLPFKTINHENSIMPTFKLNHIYLSSNNAFYKDTIVGISRYEIDKRNRFQVLLNESLKPCREEYSNDYNSK